MENIVTGQSFSAVGYHWREDDDVAPLVPQEFTDSRGFYVCDDPYSWGSPHLNGTHAVEVSYQVDNPYVDIGNSEIYETHYTDKRINDIRKHGHDAIVYISDNHRDTEAGRQIYLLKPNTQIKEITPLTQTGILTKPRKVEDAYIPDADTDDRYPLAIGIDAVQIGDEVAFSNYDVYFEQNGNLLYKPIREVMRKGQTARDFFYEAGKVNFRNALNFLHLSQYGKNAGDLTFADDWFDRLREHTIDEDSIMSKDVTLQDRQASLLDTTHSRRLDYNSKVKQAAQVLAEADRLAFDAAGFSSPSYDTALLAGEMAKHPVQPVYEDENGVHRFKPNKIIQDMQEAGLIDLNKIAGKYPHDDICQLNQLIGYSVSGWGDLSTSSQLNMTRADIQEERLNSFSSIDGEINYLRKSDDIPLIDGWHVTLDAEKYELPIELPILLQRITTFDGHYSLSVNSKESWEVEWVDSSFYGHCSYNLTPDSPDEAPEFPVGSINLKVNENHLLLERIGEPDSGNVIMTFDWPTVAEQVARSGCELPTVVNFSISKLLTNYGTFTKQSADFQGIYQMGQAVLRFMASRKFIIDNLSPGIFEPELYAKLYKAISAGPVKDNEAVNKLIKAVHRGGTRGQIQTAFKHIANSDVLYENATIHLETDRAVYDAHVTEIEELINKYL